MKTQIYDCLNSILESNKEILLKNWDHEYDKTEKEELLKNIYTERTHHLVDADKTRILFELEKLGPIEALLQDAQVTEILVNQHNQVIFEKFGNLHLAEDFFFSSQTYQDCIERLCQMCGTYINKEKPFLETQLGRWRITIIYSDLARGHHLLSIRKQPDSTLVRWIKKQTLKMN